MLRGTEENKTGMSALTDKVIHSMSHHVGGFGGAVKAQVLCHRLLFLGRFTNLLKQSDKDCKGLMIKQVSQNVQYIGKIQYHIGYQQKCVIFFIY